MVVIFPAWTIFLLWLLWAFLLPPEDKAYASVFKSISSFIFHQTLRLNIDIGFHGGIQENAEIIVLQFDDSYILLDADKGTLVSQTDNFFDDDMGFE